MDLICETSQNKTKSLKVCHQKADYHHPHLTLFPWCFCWHLQLAVSLSFLRWFLSSDPEASSLDSYSEITCQPSLFLSVILISFCLFHRRCPLLGIERGCCCYHPPQGIAQEIWHSFLVSGSLLPIPGHKKQLPIPGTCIYLSYVCVCSKRVAILADLL